MIFLNLECINNKMDDDLIKFLDALACILSVCSVWVCYICIKTRKARQETPLLNPVILA